MFITADPAALSAAELSTMTMLCQDQPRLWGTVSAVARKQAGSVLLSQRAQGHASGLPTQLPYTAPILPLCVERAEGARVWDVDGHEYIDCHMGYTASILGHNPPPVLAAVEAALCGGTGAGHFVPAQVELSELVCEMVPGAERVAFFHSGGEAVAASVRIARAATGRTLVAKFEGCYHGWPEVGVYNTVVTLSGRVPAGPVDDIAPEPCTGGVSAAAGAELLILPFDRPEALELIVRRSGDLACVVVDPVPAFRATWPESCASFLTSLRVVTAEHGIPLVFDEVVTGFRLAPGGAQEAFSVPADLACYGKITSGLGLPLAAVAGRAEILDHARTDGMVADFSAGKAWVASTNCANYLSVVASLAQLRHVRDNHDEIVGRLARNHANVREQIAKFADSSGIAVSLHGSSRLQSVIALGEPAAGPTDYRAWLDHSTPERLRALLALTLHLRLHGVYTKAAPAMNLSAAHTDRDVDQIAEAVCTSLLAMARQGLVPG